MILCSSPSTLHSTHIYLRVTTPYTYHIPMYHTVPHTLWIGRVYVSVIRTYMWHDIDIQRIIEYFFFVHFLFSSFHKRKCSRLLWLMILNAHAQWMRRKKKKKKKTSFTYMLVSWLTDWLTVWCVWIIKVTKREFWFLAKMLIREKYSKKKKKKQAKKIVSLSSLHSNR